MPKPQKPTTSPKRAPPETVTKLEPKKIRRQTVGQIFVILSIRNIKTRFLSALGPNPSPLVTELLMKSKKFHRKKNNSLLFSAYFSALGHYHRKVKPDFVEPGIF